MPPVQEGSMMHHEAFIDTFTDEAEGRGLGFWLHRGQTLTDCLGLGAHIPEGFELIQGWSGPPYRVVWIWDEGQSVITYHAGEVTVSRHAREATFLDELEEAAEFFSEEVV